MADDIDVVEGTVEEAVERGKRDMSEGQGLVLVVLLLGIVAATVWKNFDGISSTVFFLCSMVLGLLLSVEALKRFLRASNNVAYIEYKEAQRQALIDKGNAEHESKRK